MDRKILYFINPVSGPKRKESPENVIAEATRKRNIKFEFAPTDPSGNFPLLAEKIISEGISDVVICGGDGTVNQVIACLLNSDVNIGIIPMGSGNGLAFTAKIPKSIDKALELIFDGHASYIDAFFINNKFSCTLSGLGFDAQVAHDFAGKSERGLRTYIQQTVKNFLRAMPYSFEITIKGRSFSTEAFFISIANSNQFGNNVKIAPKAVLNDGKLDIVVVTKMSKPKLVWSVVKHILTGEVQHHEDRIQKKDIIYLQAQNVLIWNHSLAPLHIDGEPVETYKRLEIEILPNAFRLIRPGL